jgi:putative glutamine amidotransferase
MFGICRGVQAICAFMGGKLVQDLKHENINHPLTEEHKHYIDKVNNIGVAKLLPDHFLINSYHHQAVKVVPEGFEILFKNDQTIEAIEHTSLPILGVQWHPERFYTEESAIIFDYFFKMIK